MPTYLYKFIESGEVIEVHQAFTDDALTEAIHPTTGEVKPVKKVFTPVGVSFKGGGFYKTDSRSGSSSSSSSATSGSTTPSTSSASPASSTSSSDSGSSTTSTPSTPSTPSSAPSSA